MDDFGFPYDEEGTPQERQAALAAALRGKREAIQRQRNIGTALQFHPLLKGIGQGQVADAAKQDERLAEAGKGRLSMALQARREKLQREQELADKAAGNSEWNRRNAITAAQEAANARVMAGQRARDRAADRADAADIRAQEKADADAKKKAEGMFELEDRFKNIKSRVAEIRELIGGEDGLGTWEAFGPHNEILGRKLSDIAIDVAKVKDKDSVARESEVESEKKNLPRVGLTQSNQTALGILESFEKDLESRREGAYKVRGLSLPATPVSGGAGKRIRDPKTGRTGTWDGVSELPPGIEVLP